ncbi:unnamed protein product, partial [Discosporangium mesarthrocarpum]
QRSWFKLPRPPRHRWTLLWRRSASQWVSCRHTNTRTHSDSTSDTKHIFCASKFKCCTSHSVLLVSTVCFVGVKVFRLILESDSTFFCTVPVENGRTIVGEGLQASKWVK